MKDDISLWLMVFIAGLLLGFGIASLAGIIKDREIKYIIIDKTQVVSE